MRDILQQTGLKALARASSRPSTLCPRQSRLSSLHMDLGEEATHLIFFFSWLHIKEQSLGPDRPLCKQKTHVFGENGLFPSWSLPLWAKASSGLAGRAGRPQTRGTEEVILLRPSSGSTATFHGGRMDAQWVPAAVG